MEERVKELEEILKEYLEVSESGQLCAIRCDEDNNYCNSCFIPYFEVRIRAVLEEEEE